MRLFLMIYCVLPVVVCSYAVKSFLSPLTRSGGASRTALSAYQYRILDVPEGIQVKTFAQIGVSSRMLGDPAIGKFRLTSSIPAETMQKNMNDYVDQMVKSAKGRAVFNGYRNGVIPLHAMKEVADALVPFGIEQMLVELLNANSLEPCGEKREPVDLGKSEFYESILLPDKMGFGYEDQKARWQPGNPFRFAAQFFAIIHEAAEEQKEPSKETGITRA